MLQLIWWTLQSNRWSSTWHINVHSPGRICWWKHTGHKVTNTNLHWRSFCTSFLISSGDSFQGSQPDDLRGIVLTTLLAAGWDYRSTDHTSTIFPHELRIASNGESTPAIAHLHVTGHAPSWQLNYPVLSFLMNGQYYSEYQGIFSLMGLPVMLDTAWQKVVVWLGRHVEALAKSCDQVQKKITDRGDKLQWTASYDGFYLTRGHHSNNCSATLHDYSTDKTVPGTLTEARGAQKLTGKVFPVELKGTCWEQF